jgi:hypothetical protein
MGHTRLGTIPKTRKWVAVVNTVTADSSSSLGAPSTVSQKTDQIASQTLDAAQGGLNAAINDLGLRYTFFLLTQIVLAARTEDWENRLADIGLNLLDDSTLYDLTSEIQNAIDDFLFSNKHSSDISEMAQKAAGEAITSLAAPKSISMFGNDLEQVKVAIKDLSTKKGFSTLGQKFFGVFMAQFLNFYLSRVTASHVNTQNIQQIGEITKFNDTLRIHCEQSARVVYDFCGEWYSKTEYQKGIDLENSSGFVADPFVRYK